MHPDDLKLPALFHQDKAYFLRRADEHTGSWFGGPLDTRIHGMEIPANSLHHIATIGGKVFRPLMELIGGGDIQLYYGLAYEGCELRYKRSSTSIYLSQITPTAPSPDWPYPNYPFHLPYFPLQLDEVIPCTFEDFCELSCQAIEEPSPTEVIIIVPPSPILGVSMWGPSGDMNCVQIIFRYDLASHTAHGTNQCG
jgi:hypothetical protein